MEPIDLSPKSELFVATDIIKTAKELQTNLASMHPEVQTEYATHALHVIGSTETIYGARKLFIHTLGMHVLYSGVKQMSMDEELMHGTYIADAYVRSYFMEFGYIGHTAVKSLCLRLVETEVIKSSTDPSFNGEVIRSGVFVPVHAVETVLAAA